MSDWIHTCIGTAYDDDRGVRRFKADDDQEFRWLLQRFSPGDKVILGAKKYHEKARRRQFGYYRGVVLPFIAWAMGEVPEGMKPDKRILDELHATFKAKFNTRIVVGKDDQELEIIQSTSRMDTKEMAEFVDKVIHWAQTFLGVTVPPPQRTMLSGGGI